MKSTARLWLVVCALSLLGCGAEVIVEDELVEDGAGGASSSGGDGSDCTPCVMGDCGMCMYEGGDYAFACRSGHPGQDAGNCVTTGNIFGDEDGFYECWRCYAD